MTGTQAQLAAPIELPADAIEAARVPNQVRPSDVLIVGARITDDVIERVCTVEQALVDAALAAALPFLERAVRDKIADEVKRLREQYDPRYHQLAINANHMAEVTVRAGFARGGEATE